MEAVLAYGIVLLISVLVSGIVDRSILSTAVVFLVAGFIAGDSILGIIKISPDSESLSLIIELALFAVLFTDGMQIGLRDLRESWRLPGRALLIGMPLTFVFTAVLAYLLLPVSWPEAFLLGAVLSPTDPVFAQAIVGRKEVPLRLRRMLAVESGLNDGIALPIVIIMLDIILKEQILAGELVLELVGGVVIGIMVPWMVIRLEKSRFFSAELIYEPLNSFAIAVIVFSVASITNANEFLAAYTAGITISTMAPRFRDSLHGFGELIAELLKLAAIFIFGALIMVNFLDIGVGGYVFVALVLLAARPLVIALILVGSPLDRKERLAAMWFGPKGFASAVYGLLILKSGVPNGDFIFHVIAVVIVVSIIAHSSTDIIVAGWFVEDDDPDPADAQLEPEPG